MLFTVYHHLLVPIDGSELSGRAAEASPELARTRLPLMVLR